MKKILTMMAFSAISTALAVPQAVMDARQAAVAILWLDKNAEKWNAICSGSFVKIKGETFVLTAGHCVDEFPSGSYGAMLSNGDTVDLKIFNYAFFWPVADFTMFKVVDKDLDAVKDIKPLSIGKPLSTIGEPVYMWSGPLGTRINYYEGYYSGKMGFTTDTSDIDDMDWIVISATFGSSGTIVLNANGEAVGILAGGFTENLTGTFIAEIPEQ